MGIFICKTAYVYVQVKHQRCWNPQARNIPLTLWHTTSGIICPCSINKERAKTQHMYDWTIYEHSESYLENCKKTSNPYIILYDQSTWTGGGGILMVFVWNVQVPVGDINLFLKCDNFLQAIWEIPTRYRENILNSTDFWFFQRQDST